MATSRILTEQEVAALSSKWEMCKCPFCFDTFSPFSTAFRAQSGYTDMDIQNGLTPEEERYIIKLDQKLKDYTGNEISSILPPILRFNNKLDPDAIVCNKFELDEDDFPSGMYDTLGNLSKKRLCPSCHNILPEKYGKYPIKFIAVVGITKSGKTVYLSQLMNSINKYLPQLNIAISGSTEEMNRFVNEHPIRKRRDDSNMEADRLPDNTLGALLPQPIPLTVENNATRETYTLIFYDIAGENCVNPEKMAKYGPFIKNASGFLMIIDPAQFSDIFELDSLSDDIIRPEKVVQTMYTSFLADDRERAARVPFAVGFSKSDVLKRYYKKYDYNLDYLADVDYSKYGRDKHGLAMNDYESCSSTIQRILSSDRTRLGENFINTVKNQFKNVGYFAFSALNSAPVAEKVDEKVVYFINYDPKPVRVEEPLAWLLFQLGITPAMRGRKEINKKLFGKDEERIVVDEKYLAQPFVERCGGLSVRPKVNKATW